MRRHPRRRAGERDSGIKCAAPRQPAGATGYLGRDRQTRQIGRRAASRRVTRPAEPSGDNLTGWPSRQPRLEERLTRCRTSAHPRVRLRRRAPSPRLAVSGRRGWGPTAATPGPRRAPRALRRPAGPRPRRHARRRPQARRDAAAPAGARRHLRRGVQASSASTRRPRSARRCWWRRSRWRSRCRDRRCSPGPSALASTPDHELRRCDHGRRRRPGRRLRLLLLGGVLQSIGLIFVTGMIAHVTAAAAIGQRLTLGEAWAATPRQAVAAASGWPSCSGS